ncbi:hypothetical protein Afil01_12720 [Actinorhabdospora filicis]|uniref:HTH cro/C1-type domain-containing protein n=1 Tax=Actinorhabdospora filicis TaxID=1785913 RepID=A0A9W6SG07_9ACTN|nr:helix-turn-helix domain-containing protein [Actinorhabdospora filicis]GLZ76465.1 hypothetical protein Afil01_12720 [Actinorhabdospora filicis]
MTKFLDWEDAKHEIFDDEDLADIEAGAAQLVAISRAARLVEMRKERGLTQQQLAERLHVRQERVSAIERGQVANSEIATIAAYVSALGGTLEVVANFGSTRLLIA